jgi:hypothetical protein
MNLVLARASLPRNAVASLGGLLAVLAAAVLLPSLPLAALGAGAFGAALALAAPWRRFHAAAARSAFIGS